MKTLIITGFGLNCQKETKIAFEQAGSECILIHLNDLLENKHILQEVNIISFIGGFSFGDHLGSGNVFANRLLSNMKEELQQFLSQDKLIIGICNGFQILTRLGILPGLNLFKQEVALEHNDSGTFIDKWVYLKEEKSKCIFTQNCGHFMLPIRHGEGKFTALNDDVLNTLEKNGNVCLRYATENGETASNYPDNPNGSANAIAGICNDTGKVFGLMPHPEAYISVYNHPQWLQQKHDNKLPTEGIGLQIFKNATSYFA